MALRTKTLVPRLLAAGLAAMIALPATGAWADDQPDTLVTGNITPAVAGQVVGVTVAGAACAPIAVPTNGITQANGSYALVVHNCPRGRATITVNGVATATQFDLVPGVPSTGINVGSQSFKAYTLGLAKD